MISPHFWDDEDVVPLAPKTKLLACWFFSCAEGKLVPGLQKGGPQAFAEALRLSAQEIRLAMDELIAARIMQYDPRKLLVRIPNRPSYVKPHNANVLRGWYRKWGDFPDSPLKYDHVESIRRACDDRKWFAEAWSETFGTVVIPSPSRQVPLFAVSGTPNDVQKPHRDNDYLNRFETVSKRLVDDVPTSTVVVVETVTDIVNGSGKGGVGGDTSRVTLQQAAREARALWELQRELLTALPGAPPQPPEPVPGQLQPILAALSEYPAEQLEHALRVDAAKARESDRARGFFNGTSNWHHNHLRYAVNQAIPSEDGVGSSSFVRVEPETEMADIAFDRPANRSSDS